MEKVKNVIIGFGKAGKTLAQEFNEQNEKTVLIERNPNMYGGSCINVACIPSKKLAYLAQHKPKHVDNKVYYKKAIQEKNQLVSDLNRLNYENLQDNGSVEIIDGLASFVSEDLVKVTFTNGEQKFYEAERIFINTGSRPTIPVIDGLIIDSKTIHTSETIMQDENLPDHLTILGDGYIGLEFASIYSLFGSSVTVLSRNSEDNFLENEDRDVAKMVLDALRNLGIEFIFEANTLKVENNNTHLTIH